MGLECLHFPTSPLLGYETCDEYAIVSTILRVVGLITFGVHMNIAFIFKVRIFVLIKWSYRSPPIVLTIEPGMVITF